MNQELITQARCIGIDGCKGGWICAVLEGGKLIIQRFSTISDIMNTYSDTQYVLIDMPVGLQSNSEHIRPDTYARKIISERASTIFPAPCRQAIYAETVSKAYEENERVLGKKFTPLTVGIIPKIREVDTFLQSNQHFKNRLLESHPEVCFAILHGRTIFSKKNEFDGINERISVLQKFLPSLNISEIADASKRYKCMMDDVIDAICLAVVGTFAAENKYYSVPAHPMPDDTGLLMQMILPKLD
jgi:8-oxo-dGTP diphosphatase